MPIQWRPALGVGDESVDVDHRQLIELVNKTEHVLTGADGPAEVQAMLDELDAHTRAHFEREERLMQHVGYPGLAAHRHAHRKLGNQLLALRQAMLAVKAQALAVVETTHLVTMLQDWLLDHVLKEDMKVRAFLNPPGAEGEGAGAGAGQNVPG